MPGWAKVNAGLAPAHEVATGPAPHRSWPLPVALPALSAAEGEDRAVTLGVDAGGLPPMQSCRAHNPWQATCGIRT